MEKVLIVEKSKTKFEEFRNILTFENQPFSNVITTKNQNNIKKFPKFTFDYAENGDKALDLINKADTDNNPYCLVIMDIDLTRLNDDFFYPREIRKIDNYIQVIVLTTSENEFWKKVSQTLGKRDFLMILKHPFRPIELQSKAVVLFEKWRMTKIANNKISEFSEAYEQIVVEKMKADQANNAKSDFLANMSHEIRTPLNILLGIHEVLSNTELSEEQSNYLNIATRSGKNLLHLLNNLLDLSKVEAGKEYAVDIEFSSKIFFKHLFETFQFKADSLNVKFITEVSEDIPSYLIGDSEKLKIILSNLISNAIKFSENKKVTVNITKDTKAIAGKVYIRFVVSDTGIGIADDDLHRIFESFIQLKTVRPKKHAGTGLGLNIADRYVSLLGGGLTAKSKINEGSKFSFVIPLKLSEKQNDDEKEENLAPAKANLKLSQPLNILLVEDNEENVQLIQIYLEKENCKIDVAENGQEAVDLYQKNQYDVIFMDMQMPVMDGFEATKIIRSIEKEKQNRKTPILALTAYSRSHEMEACRRCGCDDVYKKPIKRRKIIAYLQNIIDRA